MAYQETVNKINYVFDQLIKNQKEVANQSDDYRNKKFFEDQAQSLEILQRAVNQQFNELRAPYRAMELPDPEPPKSPVGNN